ncbi:FtsX-like permease family protein [Tautonia sociabilis]|uniref:FtsX-like permease family protein n=1 Tax=Tautonia sociabilis TaxID=2080755 RepID=A0A432MNS6_9BACT|nr:FtsX-like permease family protein [Tautonia sociabilis]
MLANVRGALEQVWANRLRSVLTVLGIVIAVTSTITVVSVVQGFTGYVSDFLQGLGTNAMWIWPERPGGEAGKRLGRVTLDLKDVQALQAECSTLRSLSPLIPRPSATVSMGRTEVTTQLEGVSAEYHTIRNLPVEVGRPFTFLDIERRHPVCVLGREVLRKLERGDDIVGRTLLVDGRRFRVVGILAEKGSVLGNSQDDLVLIPYTMALTMYPSTRTTIALAAQALDEAQVPEAKAQVVSILRRRHRLDAYQPNDFQIRTQDEILTAFNSISIVATAVLAGIVGISLLVGGIGIMNVMLVSVTERTREIGLRKAVGARRRDIMLQFLTEAVCLSLLGGGLGVGLGYGITAIVSLHPQMVDVAVPAWAVLLGFGISAGTGVAFGILPALKAALLNPIDALRHE